MKEPDSLEDLLKLLKKYNVMHFAGAVEVDFTCQACSPEQEASIEQEATVIRLEPKPPEEVDPATGLTKEQSDELFHSAEP